MLELDGITIKWLGHDSMKIKGDKVIYIDPWKLKDTEPADIVLITHDHYDHCSPEDVSRIMKKGTVVVGAADVGKKFKSATKIGGFAHLFGEKENFKVVKAGDKITINGVTVEAVPAYNTNKQFHPRASGWVGYIVTMNGKRIYHAGDTDHIPEMETMKDIDVALVPVSGTYVMTAEEAAQAVNKMMPKIAVPMHYGDIIGTKADAEQFKKLAEVEVRII